MLDNMVQFRNGDGRQRPSVGGQNDAVVGRGATVLDSHSGCIMDKPAEALAELPSSGFARYQAKRWDNRVCGYPTGRGNGWVIRTFFRLIKRRSHAQEIRFSVLSSVDCHR
jgi:hypothetical protein